MKLRNIFLLKYFAVIAGALLMIAAPALAGPPLICHAIDVGAEQSLPWTSTGWNLSGQEQYDVSRLVPDTLALLTPSAPVLLRLEARTRENPKDALAAFDFGYLVECYKQASWLHKHTDWLKASGDATGANLATKIDGYSWVVKAITLRGSDPQMEFAAALMTTEGARSEHERHLQSAMAGAKADAMLARNLSSRFPKNAA